jgi:membrane protein insertase Oxa1/YidC/SpoIIIJ
MFTKILLTLTVIVGIAFFLRMKGAENESSQSATTRRSPATKKEPSEGQKMFRQGAYLFLIFMAISAAVMVYYEIGDRYKTVTVQVVNTQTGERSSYQAEQQNIKSDRFTTLEGKTVYIAEIERIEIVPE